MDGKESTRSKRKKDGCAFSPVALSGAQTPLFLLKVQLGALSLRLLAAKGDDGKGDGSDEDAASDGDAQAHGAPEPALVVAVVGARPDAVLLTGVAGNAPIPKRTPARSAAV